MLKLHAAAVLLAACLTAGQAAAQARVQTPGPQPLPQRGVQAPEISPSSQANAAILLRLNEIEQSARRQIVVLEQVEDTAQAELWPIATDNFENNVNRARAICTLALTDRFGRVVSYQRTFTDDRYFFHRVVCETQ